MHDIPLEQPGAVRAFEAIYQGQGTLTVDLYEMKVAGLAFEMTQHWRPAPAAVFFDKGRYFLVVNWQDANREALTAFVRAMQKQLNE